MKRMLSFCLVIILLLTAIPIVSSVALSQYGTVTGGWLRLRSGPSFDSSTIDSYYTGTQVKILSTSGYWYEVETPDGNTGYMYGTYISFSGGGTGTAYVTSSNGLGVRMRTGPGTGYRVIGVYSVGTALTVLQSGTYWSRISIGSQTGYMMNKFITTNGGGGGSGDSATIWSANGYGVRLRSGPGTGYSIIGVYSVGTNVTVITHGTTWDYISVGSRTGYMMNEFLRYNSSMVVTSVTLSNTTPIVGTELSATLTPTDATVEYKWYAGSSVVATTSTYTVTSDDLDKQIKLKVTGIDSYSGTVTSALTSAVKEPIPVTGVSLNNSRPVVGDVLAAVDILPTGAKVTYRWFVGGTFVSNETTYTVQSDDVGKLIKLKVTGSGIYTDHVTVAAESVVDSEGLLTDVKIVNKTNSSDTDNLYPNIGDVLVATPVPATAPVAYKWRFKDDPTKVLGTSATLTLTSTIAGYSIEGHTLEVVCVAKSPYSGSFKPYTGPVVKRTNIGTLTIDKMLPKFDPSSSTISTLTATVLAASTAANATSSCNFQWYNDSVAITGATGSTYALQITDTGHLISVTATAKTDSTYSGSLTKVTSRTVQQRIVNLAIDGSTSSSITKTGEVLKPVLDNGDTATSFLNATFTWTLDGTTATTLEYMVPALNLSTTKTLVLKVVGKGDYYTDEVNYDPITQTLTLQPTDITVTIPATAPVSGTTFAATVSPATASATYSWKSESGTTYSGSSITVNSVDIGKKLTLTVTPGNGYTTSTSTLVSLAVQPKEITTGSFVGSNQAGKPISIDTDIPLKDVGSVTWTYTKDSVDPIIFNILNSLSNTNPTGSTGYTLTAKITGAGDYLGSTYDVVPTVPWIITAVTITTSDLTSSSLDAVIATGGTTATDDSALEGSSTVSDGDTGTTDGTITDGDTGTTDGTVTDGDTGTTDGTVTDSDTGTDSTEADTVVEEASVSEASAPISYEVSLAYDTASIGVNTVFTAIASPSDLVESYAWYLNDYQIPDAYGNTYRITSSDYSAGNVLKVVVNFSGDHSAYNSMTLAYASSDTTDATTDSGSTDGTLISTISSDPSLTTDTEGQIEFIP